MQKFSQIIALSLIIAFLPLPENAPFALEKINVTLPSKSFQFVIFPIAKERGYMKEEGIDLNIAIMASTVGIQSVVAGDMHFTGSGSSALVAVTNGNGPAAVQQPERIEEQENRRNQCRRRGDVYVEKGRVQLRTRRK